MQTPHPLVRTKYKGDWTKLKALPLLPCKEHNPPLEIGELFVVVDRVDSSQLPEGSIVQLKEDDGSLYPYFYGSTEGNDKCACYRINRVARLPKDCAGNGKETKKEKSSIQLIHPAVYEQDGVQYTDGEIYLFAHDTSIRADKQRFTPDEMKEHIRQCRTALDRYNRMFKKTK